MNQSRKDRDLLSIYSFLPEFANPVWTPFFSSETLILVFDISVWKK